MALNHRIWSLFWTKWGPAIKISSRAAVHILKALVLIGLGLVGNLITVLTGLEWLGSCLVNTLEHLLELVE